jgi:thymidylate synthase (FAD)
MSKGKGQVHLISWTPYADAIAGHAAAICWKGKDPMKSLQVAMKKGHTSVLEHNCFTWRINGISSAALAQMTRHRIGCSYSVQSFRFTTADPQTMAYMPYAVAERPDVASIYNNAMVSSFNAYRELLGMGISKEDARYLLPLAFGRSMIVSMNARALLHFAALRTAKDAEAEIRGIAVQMYESAREQAPEILPPLEPNNLA